MGLPNSTTIGYRRPLGYQQISAATLAASTHLTLPTPLPNGMQVGYTVIQNNGTGPVRWRDDGTAPTTTVGMVLPNGSELDYFGEMTALLFIAESGAPILDIDYYA